MNKLTPRQEKLRDEHYKLLGTLNHLKNLRGYLDSLIAAYEREFAIVNFRYRLLMGWEKDISSKLDLDTLRNIINEEV